MNLSDPVAALEIGTTHTVIAVGEPLGGGRIRVAALGDIASAGIQKSEIHQFSQARFSIESVLKKLSDQTDYSIAQAYLAVSGPQIRTQLLTRQCQIDGGKVREEHIAELEDRSYETALPEDREPIEIESVCYRLDDHEETFSPPLDLNGRLLARRSLCIHASAQRVADACSAAQAAKLEILPEKFFVGTCAAAAVLTPQQKKDGALVIDLGGGSTAYTAWSGGRLVAAGVVGVGGNHVTDDIRIAFAVSRGQAEQLKIGSASATISPEDATQRIAVPDPMPGFKTATVSRRALNTVVNARLQELFTIIRTRLADEGCEIELLNAGVFLTGGGAAMPRIVDLAGTVFGGMVRIGRIIPEIEGLEKDAFPAGHAVIAGLLLLAQQQDPPATSFLDWLKKIFGISSKK